MQRLQQKKSSYIKHIILIVTYKLNGTHRADASVAVHTHAGGDTPNRRAPL